MHVLADEPPAASRTAVDSSAQPSRTSEDIADSPSLSQSTRTVRAPVRSGSWSLPQLGAVSSGKTETCPPAMLAEQRSKLPRQRFSGNLESEQGVRVNQGLDTSTNVLLDKVRETREAGNDSIVMSKKDYSSSLPGTNSRVTRQSSLESPQKTLENSSGRRPSPGQSTVGGREPQTMLPGLPAQFLGKADERDTMHMSTSTASLTLSPSRHGSLAISQSMARRSMARRSIELQSPAATLQLTEDQTGEAALQPPHEVHGAHSSREVMPSSQRPMAITESRSSDCEQVPRASAAQTAVSCKEVDALPSKQQVHVWIATRSESKDGRKEPGDIPEPDFTGEIPTSFALGASRTTTGYSDCQEVEIPEILDHTA